ncbi:phosphoesterase RecJ-like protein [Natranaerovirga hydrolytica]|uniref:Phosphoesterase RecJ-like protein n=1 Tax=Natranaerovirga hydrolytica TaxID=680378 RepID=A0A4V2Q1K2_9FIRM|nr:bifunctional oligoribonuclease/PAP phosphatase NrnA [Natranaerovirga hydrolytica]TCK97941.1 phosphoesterase RecJ-like protein [Natranaerovirga hydrolytica]
MDKKLEKIISKNNKIMLAGHIKPDGDSIGAALALSRYIQSKFKDKQVDIYMENMPPVYDFLIGNDRIITSIEDLDYDLFIALDCGDQDRLGEALRVFQNASSTVNIDHHISNPKYAQINYVTNISSTCEYLCELLDMDCFNNNIAKALYTGIVFDTGGMKHSNTTKNTFNTLGQLIEYDFDFSMIMDQLFNQKTYLQNKLLGQSLLNAQTALDHRVIYSILTKDDFEKHESNPGHTEGIVEQLRVTKDVLMAFFIYEHEDNAYKISLRSKDKIDVCKIAQHFNGGGHTKASGCSYEGDIQQAVDKIIALAQEQI